MVIAINPGHDRQLDPGACGEFLREADVVDEIAHLVLQGLQNVGHEAYYIQSNELSEISADAMAVDADIFVSIHCNAAENRSAEGTETYYYPDAPSECLADCIQQNVVEYLGTEDRGCKDGSWIAVLKHTEVKATVLVELGFISNPEEEEKLAACKAEAAAAIVDGIAQYIAVEEMLVDE